MRKCGPFCSQLIARVFATHLRKISAGQQAQVPQIGGLALAAAAVCFSMLGCSPLLTVTLIYCDCCQVERGLMFFSTGNNALTLSRDPQTGRTRPHGLDGVGFTDLLWGEKTHAYVETTMNLSDEQWDAIFKHTAHFISTSPPDMGGESSGNADNNAGSVSRLQS